MKTKTRSSHKQRTPTTAAGRRLVKALGEVLDDVKGITPLSEVAIVPETIDVLSIRQRIGLSQAAFASRFGISKRTLQEWEQGRHAPDAMARAFLTVIAKEPDAVRRALAA